MVESASSMALKGTSEKHMFKDDGFVLGQVDKLDDLLKSFFGVAFYEQ